VSFLIYLAYTFGFINYICPACGAWPAAYHENGEAEYICGRCSALWVSGRFLL
tara:strand:+ start:519 stop:677 length:159 start_codon:yes stop_codon:yes gene_type:complete